ncbi:hypothetical protein K458DRAFT_387271 [Lentithecium fluviatile CBS 122367]|uniref:Uncharacterized protein n=1 Tax=Lentithecium fluviatile CBS 122367 TaxID=1168545 RepID=A0A6G1J7Q8_9PLEO|nr:hypothetical protein K458DRAFT_387271 [Lentithecium fluviatile CBS 122367]
MATVTAARNTLSLETAGRLLPVNLASRLVGGGMGVAFVHHGGASKPHSLERRRAPPGQTSGGGHGGASLAGLSGIANSRRSARDPLLGLLSVRPGSYMLIRPLKRTGDPSHWPRHRQAWGGAGGSTSGRLGLRQLAQNGHAAVPSGPQNLAASVSPYPGQPELLQKKIVGFAAMDSRPPGLVSNLQTQTPQERAPEPDKNSSLAVFPSFTSSNGRGQTTNLACALKYRE